MGRPLASGSNGTVSLNWIPVGTQYDTRLYQLDLRLTKTVKRGNTRARVDFDVANALNASSVLTTNTSYGPSWLTATAIFARWAQLESPKSAVQP